MWFSNSERYTFILWFQVLQWPYSDSCHLIQCIGLVGVPILIFRYLLGELGMFPPGLIWSLTLWGYTIFAADWVHYSMNQASSCVTNPTLCQAMLLGSQLVCTMMGSTWPLVIHIIHCLWLQGNILALGNLRRGFEINSGIPSGTRYLIWWAPFIIR
jgi:hypothetical protein